MSDQYTENGSGRPPCLPSAAADLPLMSLVESVLFVADEPVRVDHLAAILEVKRAEVDLALQRLCEQYSRNRGIRLQFNDDCVQMVTAPEASTVIRRFLDLDTSSKLSPAALETLAVVAYRQPVTRAQIEAIRGVNSDSVIRTLVSRGLIEEQGRLEQAGRPIVYGTTFFFLQQFGLSTLAELPPLIGSEAQ